VALTGNTPGYVTDNTPANETTYHARFYFNPRGTLSANTQMDIFAARNTVGAPVVRVQYRRTGAGLYQVRLAVNRFGGVTNSNWVTIANNTAHYIELDWQSAASATIRFYVNGVLQQTLTGLNTSQFTIDSALLGPSGGLVAGSSGTPYFDHFESRHTTYIGP
jgi:aromatic ring-cleaving dioxygenase